MAEPVKLSLDGFAPPTAGKVRQLVRLLDALDGDPVCGPAVCLHGGTALNLFVLGAPRLSVDIDLNYIGATGLGQMRKDRPNLEQAVIGVAEDLGFDVVAGKPQHAGRSFRLYYHGPAGSDHVKIDLDYLNRSPLLPPETKAIQLGDGAVINFRLNSAIELIAGKTKALVERVAVRDLYDIGQINRYMRNNPIAGEDDLLTRRTILYYLSVSTPFPRPFHVADRFVGRQGDVETQLYPMLAAGERPSLSDMIETAEHFLAAVSTPHDGVEAMYLHRAARADFAPELLFADYPDVLAAARVDPGMRWKMTNLAAVLHTTTPPRVSPSTGGIGQ